MIDKVSALAEIDSPFKKRPKKTIPPLKEFIITEFVIKTIIEKAGSAYDRTSEIVSLIEREVHSNPHAPATTGAYACDIANIWPQPECFGRWKGIDDEGCEKCPTWGYCADLTTRTLAERNRLLEIIKNTNDEICGAYGMWEMNSCECQSFDGNCTLCKITKAIALLQAGEP